MDAAHRDRVAFVRVCSGTFQRGMVVTHAGTGKPFATKYAQSMFGRDRSTVDTAYPGDVIGLVNASSLTVGDTLFSEEPVVYPRIPQFAPEHFAVPRARDSGRYKQFRRGVHQLEQEGVVQVLRSDRRGDQAPVFAAVGPMQFEVAEHRMEHEFGAPISLERLGLLGRPPHRRRHGASSSPPTTAPRCWNAPTASCWPCSPIAGDCRTSRANGPVRSSNRCPPISSLLPRDGLTCGVARLRSARREVLRDARRPLT